MGSVHNYLIIILSYANSFSQILFDEVEIGNRESTRHRKLYPEDLDLPMLITFETHSIIGTGEGFLRIDNEMLIQMHQLRKTNVMKVVEHYLSYEYQNYIKGSISPIKDLITLISGHIFTLNFSWNDLKELMKR